MCFVKMILILIILADIIWRISFPILANTNMKVTVELHVIIGYFLYSKYNEMIINRSLQLELKSKLILLSLRNLHYRPGSLYWSHNQVIMACCRSER
jgi:hypothetical protein